MNSPTLPDKPFPIWHLGDRNVLLVVYIKRLYFYLNTSGPAEASTVIMAEKGRYELPGNEGGAR